MTREEAKRRLLDIERCTPIHTREDARDFEALEMAIQALSQEPTEKPMTVDEMEREYEKSKALFHKIVECDDAISREAVIDAIRFGISNIRAFNDTTMIRFYERENEALKKAIERVNKLPSVTQRSGKWIEKDGWDGDVYYECSVCEEPFCLIDGTPTDNMYNYCPNCGAKMVEPQGRSRK